MSVLDDMFAALAQPANGTAIIVHGVATLTGTIALADDDLAGQTAICNVVATGIVQQASLVYARPRAGSAAAVRFWMPLHYVWPANFVAAESTAVTLTKHAAEPSYSLELGLPWADVAFTARFDAPSGIVYGSANNALVALALSLAFEPPERRKPHAAVPVVRGSVKRSREARRR